MPRPDVSEERRNQILDAAAVVFSREGIDAANMQAIARESQISKALIYHYFASKDEVIAALMARLFEQDLIAAHHLVDSDEPAAERLERFMDLTLTGLESMPEALPVMVEFYVLALRQTEVRAMVSRYYQGFMEPIKTIIQQGSERGEFRAVDAGKAAAQLIATFEGTLLVNLIIGDLGLVRRRMAVMVEMFVMGLKVS